jgi:hypothetical protein
MPDKITGMTVICEYTLWPVDIFSFCPSRFLPASLSLSLNQRQSFFIGVYTRETLYQAHS